MVAPAWIHRVRPVEGSRRLTSTVDIGTSDLLGKQGGEALQVQRPALVAVHAFSDPLPSLAVAVQVAVFELDPGALGPLGDETDLDLARLLRVGLDLPPRADIPADDHAVGRVVDQDPGPTALAAVD